MNPLLFSTIKEEEEDEAEEDEVYLDLEALKKQTSVRIRWNLINLLNIISK